MNNRREGKGKLTWGEAGEDFVEGVFRNHKVQGVGIEVHTHRVYKGEFEEGLYHGKGVAHFRAGKNGDTKGTYDGAWKAGEKEGYGVYDCKEAGVTYEGEWLAGEPAVKPIGIWEARVGGRVRVGG